MVGRPRTAKDYASGQRNPIHWGLMADGNLTQEEAEALIAMEKVRAAEEDYSYPRPGDKLTIPLTSKDKREMFLLDISRARIDLAKVSYQNRARQVVVLLRLDLAGPPIETRMVKRSLVRISMYIGRGSVTSGRFQLHWTSFQTRRIYSRHTKASFNVAT